MGATNQDLNLSGPKVCNRERARRRETNRIGPAWRLEESFTGDIRAGP